MILLQEEFKNDPWKMLVACVLLNQTTGKQVKTVIYNVFETYPTAESMAKAEPMLLGSMITPLGFRNVRTKRLIDMSKHISTVSEWKNSLDKVPGVGKYAMDSWSIFQDGRIDIEVTDKELKAYIDSIIWERDHTIEEKMKSILGPSYGGPSLSFMSGRFIIYEWGDAPVAETIWGSGETLEECYNDYKKNKRSGICLDG